MKHPGIEMNNHGRPVIKGTGVHTEVVAQRFAAGKSIYCLAVDYGVNEFAIAWALSYELDNPWQMRLLLERLGERSYRGCLRRVLEVLEFLHLPWEKAPGLDAFRSRRGQLLLEQWRDALHAWRKHRRPDRNWGRL